MYNQGVGDYFSTNYYSGPPVYDHCPQGHGYGGRWHCHQPFNSWGWNNGYNGYGADRQARCSAAPPAGRTMEAEYQNYEHNLGANDDMRNDNERSPTGDPIWKTIKIDCFRAQMGRMDLSKTQSEIISTSSGSTICRMRTPVPRRNRKAKLNTNSRSTTSLRLLLEELNKKVSLNESVLAFVLLKLNSKKDDEQRCAGGDENTPYACYSSEKLQNIENDLLDKLKKQVERSESGTTDISVDKKFIKNWNKLYNGLGGGLRYDAKPKCTCKLSGEEIRKEFETYFQQRCGEQTKTNSKKPSEGETKTDLKNSKTRPALAKVCTNRTNALAQPKLAKVAKPVLKTKQTKNEGKIKKNTKVFNPTMLKPPTMTLGKKYTLSNNKNKTQTKYLPQDVRKSKAITNKNKKFMPASGKYRIYLDNKVYAVDTKKRK